MERLTERTISGQVYLTPEPETDIYGNRTEKGFLQSEDIYNRLADYEDTGFSPAEIMGLKTKFENGTLVELPCKIGSLVYLIRQDTQMICECKVIMFYSYQNENGGVLRVELNMIEDKRTTVVFECAFGKTVFLTLEEAEKKLKESENIK